MGELIGEATVADAADGIEPAGPPGTELAAGYDSAPDAAASGFSETFAEPQEVDDGEETVDPWLSGYLAAFEEIEAGDAGGADQLAPLDPNDPDSVAAHYEQAVAVHEALLEQVAEAAGLPFEVVAAADQQQFEAWRAEREMVAQAEAAESARTLSLALDEMRGRLGDFDPEQAVDLARQTYAEVSRQFGPDEAARNAAAILEAAAAQLAADLVHGKEIGVRAATIGGNLDTTGIYDPERAYEIAATVFPEVLKERGGDEQRALVDSLDVGMRVAAGPRGIVGNRELANYHAAKARFARAVPAGQDPRALAELRAQAGPPEVLSNRELALKYTKRAADARARGTEAA